MISICSQQCNCSMKRRWSYCFKSFAQNAEIHMSGKLRDYTIGQEWEVNYLYNGQLSTCRCIKTVVNSSSVLSRTSRLTDQFYYSRKLGPLLDPVTTRSDKHACGKPMLTDHDKQATENREPANETNKEDPWRKACLFGYSPSQSIWRTLRRKCLHTFRWKSELRFGRWCFQRGDTKT